MIVSELSQVSWLLVCLQGKNQSPFSKPFEIFDIFIATSPFNFTTELNQQLKLVFKKKKVKKLVETFLINEKVWSCRVF